MAGGKVEYLAGIYDITSATTNTRYIFTADSKYKNVYTTEYIPGDATKETPQWRGANNANFVTSSGPVFNRSYSGVFSYSYNDGCAYSNRGSRVCVVSGVGL